MLLRFVVYMIRVGRVDAEIISRKSERKDGHMVALADLHNTDTRWHAACQAELGIARFDCRRVDEIRVIYAFRLKVRDLAE